MDGLQAVTAVTISGALVIGMVLALLGSIKLALARQLQVGEGRIGGLLSALNIALIPTMLLAGYLIDHFSVRFVLLLGSLITSVALFSMSLSPTYKRAFLAVLFTGLGLAALSAAVVVLMPLSFFPPKSTRAEETAALNLGFVFIALGALITPVLSDILLRTLAYRKTVMLLALLCLVPAFLCLVPAFGDEVTKRTSDMSTESLNWEDGLYWHVLLAGLVFFFYAPVEGSIGTWSTTLLTESGYSERRAAVLLSCFWGAFLSSRLLIAFLRLSPAWDPWLIAIPAVLTAVVLGNLSGSVGERSARNGLLLLGLLLGPIFPTLVGVLFREFKTDRGTLYGLLFAIGSLGSLLAAPLIGLRVRNSNAHTALRLTMLLALLLSGTAMVFALIVGSGRL